MCAVSVSPAPAILPVAESAGASSRPVPLQPRLVLQSAAGLPPPGERVRSGFHGIDAILPAGGVRRGSLLEWIAATGVDGRGLHGTGSGMEAGACRLDARSGGAVTLAMAVAASVAGAPRGPRAIIVIDRGGRFHPPAVLGWPALQPWPARRHAGGREPAIVAGGVRLVVVRPSRDDDEAWAIDQALRCVGVAAVVAWPSSAVAAPATHRRWKLAARGSGVVGLFVRPWSAAHEPSWAEARLAVTPLPLGMSPGIVEVSARRWRVERLASLLHGEGRACELTIDLQRGVEIGSAGHRDRRQEGGRPSRGERREVAVCRAS